MIKHGPSKPFRVVLDESNTATRVRVEVDGARSKSLDLSTVVLLFSLTATSRHLESGAKKKGAYPQLQNRRRGGV